MTEELQENERGTPIIVFFEEEVTQTTIYEIWFQDGVPADEIEREEAIRDHMAEGHYTLKNWVTDTVLKSKRIDVKIGIDYETYIRQKHSAFHRKRWDDEIKAEEQENARK